MEIKGHYCANCNQIVLDISNYCSWCGAKQEGYGLSLPMMKLSQKPYEEKWIKREIEFLERKLKDVLTFPEVLEADRLKREEKEKELSSLPLADDDNIARDNTEVEGASMPELDFSGEKEGSSDIDPKEKLDGAIEGDVGEEKGGEGEDNASGDDKKE